MPGARSGEGTGDAICRRNPGWMQRLGYRCSPPQPQAPRLAPRPASPPLPPMSPPNGYPDDAYSCGPPFTVFAVSPGCIIMSAGLSSRASGPELVGKVVEVLAHDIERPLRFGFASTRAALPRPPNMAGAQPKLLSARQVAAVRGAHPDLLGLEVERLASHQINLRLCLIALPHLATAHCFPAAA